MTLVKICGIRTPEHALDAANAGADMIGVNFYPPSPRVIDLTTAKLIRQAIDSLSPARRPRLVGLFVNESADHVNAVADAVCLDIVQLSGDEPPAMVDAIERPCFSTVRIDSSGKVDEELRFRELIAAEPLAVLTDSHVPGLYGGTGTVADWIVAADFARRYPLLLAGGLRPDNVAAAIERVRPWAVDVSSGVEVNGVKNPEAITAFINAARAAVPIGGSA